MRLRINFLINPDMGGIGGFYVKNLLLRRTGGNLLLRRTGGVLRLH